MTSFLSNRIVRLVLRLVLGGIFVYAAAGKIIHPAHFADSVAAFRILPVKTVNIFAIVLPWVEAICGLLLLVGVMVESSALLTILMNLTFIAAVSFAMARGLDIECGCFTLSKAHVHVGWQLIGRDILLIALALPLLFNADRTDKESTASDTDKIPLVG